MYQKKSYIYVTHNMFIVSSSSHYHSHQDHGVYGTLLHSASTSTPAILSRFYRSWDMALSSGTTLALT